MRFRKKPVVVEATQWFKIDDHPQIRPWPGDIGPLKCRHCNQFMECHGWTDTLEGGHIVCPGDWIITDVKGETYPVKPDIFAETYERADAF